MKRWQSKGKRVDTIDWGKPADHSTPGEGAAESQSHKHISTRNVQQNGQSVSRTLSALRVSYLNFLSSERRKSAVGVLTESRVAISPPHAPGSVESEAGGEGDGAPALESHDQGRFGERQGRHRKVNVLTLMFYKLLLTHLWHNLLVSACLTGHRTILRKFWLSP